MFAAFAKGVSQLNDAATRKVLWLATAAAVAAFAALWAGVGYLLTATKFFDIGWLDVAVDLLGGLATLVLTWFLFPGVVAAVIGFFLEDIADAVEARHYPDLPAAKKLTLAGTVVTTLSYLAAALLLNLLTLAFLVVPPVFPFVFYAVNGYLLSREFFELVALRRLAPDEARALRKARRWQLFFAGVTMAVLLTVPLVNLLAPVVATAAMVHLFEGWRRSPSRK
jgi:uncharacterized protein involved in cysteine biosynthesis